MFNLKTVFFIATAMAITGCAGKTPRTKWTDKTMRVMIDPDSIDANNYVRIQQALIESGKWTVVDRATAFNAIKKEQERLHRTESDRFDDREKFAIWGRMLGVGGVVTAHTQCVARKGFLRHEHLECLQNLAIVDSNTGEVIATSEAQEDGAADAGVIAPSWETAVDRMNDAYPRNFEPSKITKQLESYKDLAYEEALRQKEAQAKKTAQ